MTCLDGREPCVCHGNDGELRSLGCARSNDHESLVFISLVVLDSTLVLRSPPRTTRSPCPMTFHIVHVSFVERAVFQRLSSETGWTTTPWGHALLCSRCGCGPDSVVDQTFLTLASFQALAPFAKRLVLRTRTQVDDQRDGMRGAG